MRLHPPSLAARSWTPQAARKACASRFNEATIWLTEFEESELDRQLGVESLGCARNSRQWMTIATGWHTAS